MPRGGSNPRRTAALHGEQVTLRKTDMEEITVPSVRSASSDQRYLATMKKDIPGVQRGCGLAPVEQFAGTPDVEFCASRCLVEERSRSTRSVEGCMRRPPMRRRAKGWIPYRYLLGEEQGQFRDAGGVQP